MNHTKEFVAYEGPKFTIEWYHDEDANSQALNFFNASNDNDQDKLMYLFKRMGDFGKISDKTKFRNEGDGIYAFKPKDKRFLCFFMVGKKIIITNALPKNYDKLPKSEKTKALSIKSDYLKRTEEGTYY